MNILDFVINYPDEETCQEKFNELSCGQSFIFLNQFKK